MERFRQESVTSNLNGKIESYPFESLPGSDRDKFGNRFVGSGSLGLPEKGYVNKDQGNSRAGLLISPEGQQLFKDNPSLLQDLDKAMVLHSHFEVFSNEFTDVSPNVQVSVHSAEGSQSNVFDLVISGKHYIGKSQLDAEISVYNNNQSYVNEMLEIQTLQDELGDKLAELGIRLPKIYFATSQFMLREFIEGDAPVDKDIETIKGKLKKLLNNFLSKKNKQIWHF